MATEERMSRNENQAVPEVRNEKELAALSYVWIFSIFILLARRENSFIQHHARRGTVLFALSLLFWWIPVLYYGEILVLVLSVLGFIKASMGDEYLLPVLSEIADGTLHRREVRGYMAKVREEAGKIAESAEQAVSRGPSSEESARMLVLTDRLAADEDEIQKLEEEVKKVEGELEALKKG